MSRLILILVAVQIMGSLGRAIDDPENAAAVRAVANDDLEFTKQFYKASIKGVSGNFISSSLSVRYVLSMLTYGARGDTQTALKSGLHFNKDDNVQRKGLKTLTEELNNSPGVELKLANKIFLANDVTVKPDYQQLTEEIFKSTAQKVDFSKTADASQIINDWCAEQTNSKITEIVSKDTLAADTLALLVNAVYFKGDWEEKFNKQGTRDAPFHLEDGTTKDVPTMHSFRKYKYGVLDDVKAKFAELPYKGGQVSMYIILPDEVTGLRNIQQNFAELNLNRLLTEGVKSTLDFSLPKFEIQTEIDLKQPLTDLGMGNIFGDTADLSGMLETPAKVGKAVQKAYIKVDEEGTEAAAITSVGIVPMSMPMSFPFKVDRPFYFAIIKRIGGPQGSGVVLFQGHYKTPKLTSRISLVLISLQILGCFGKAIEDSGNYMAMREVAGDINKFSSEFYEAASKDQDENLILSPLSVSTSLSMLTYGARGNSEAELKKALHFNENDALQKRGVQTLIETLNEFTKVDLKVANHIFVGENRTINEDFKKIAETVFKSGTEKVDYSNAKEATAKINKWAEDHTNAKIKDLVSEDDISADTAMVLVNAVYFKGNWANQFNASLTKNETFTLGDGTKKEVEMMHIEGDFRYGVLESVDATFVELPYESNDMSDEVSMFIVLPNESTNLTNLVKNVAKINFIHLLTGITAEVNLSLPKFKIASKRELQGPLNGLGIKEIFSDSADLSGLADGDLLKVSKIVQKAVIEVNEEGSEAAAATASELENRFGWDDAKKKVDFVVNRPFIAAIATQDVFLFVASVYVPEY